MAQDVSEQQRSKEKPCVVSDTTVRYLLTVNVDFATEQFKASASTLVGLLNPGLAELFQCHVFRRSTTRTRTTCTSILVVTSIVVVVPEASIVTIVHIIASTLLGMPTASSCTNSSVARKPGLKNASKVTLSKLFED